jgi:hypothetical protein
VVPCQTTFLAKQPGSHEDYEHGPKTDEGRVPCLKFHFSLTPTQLARPRNVYYASQADKTHDDISMAAILCRIAHITQKISGPPLDDPGHLIGREDESEQFGPAIRLNMRNDQDRGGCTPTLLFRSLGYGLSDSDIADKLGRAELSVRSCINCFISEVHELKNWFHTLPLQQRDRPIA